MQTNAVLTGTVSATPANDRQRQARDQNLSRPCSERVRPWLKKA